MAKPELGTKVFLFTKADIPAVLRDWRFETETPAAGAADGRGWPELAAAVEPLPKAREAVGRQSANVDRKVMRLARNDAQVRCYEVAQDFSGIGRDADQPSEMPAPRPSAWSARSSILLRPYCLRKTWQRHPRHPTVQ